VTGYLEDHGWPLVQLKKQRCDLIVTLMRRPSGPVSKEQIAEIAAIQHAIAAVEAVIVDLDAKTYFSREAASSSLHRVNLFSH
jgi:hypothetical protein